MATVLELAHVIVEPSRWKIIKSLIKDPKYISQIASSTESERATVSYHLGVLEKYGLVSSEYKILNKPQSKGTAARVYHINIDTLLSALDEVEKILPEIRPK
ncbi:MAG: hypothetical protein AMJ37_01950 [Dehalococcoidia bacterium DG_18]|nr:MAG: hypothetical protein AMJ37_01950 [Dehalococcoidia bacterium DG_18]